MMTTPAKRPFYQWDETEHKTWGMLYERAWPRVVRRACRMYHEGHKRMGMNAQRLPDFAVLDVLYQQRVGWELVSTPVQYSDGQDWFEHLIKKQFLITEYIRERDSLDYTPLPDIFHDAFGHLPFMMHQRYANLVLDYARLMLLADVESRPALGSIWWYTIEFGLIKEDGEIKAFGAGLMSSYEEIETAFSDRVKRSPFNPAEMGQVKPSPHEIHKQLWILDSFDQLETFVKQQLARFQPV